MNPPLPHLKLKDEGAETGKGQLLLSLPVGKKDLPQKSAVVLESEAYMPQRPESPPPPANGIGFGIASIFNGIGGWLERMGWKAAAEAPKPALAESQTEVPDAIKIHWNETANVLTVTRISTNETRLYIGNKQNVAIVEQVGHALPGLSELPKSAQDKVTEFRDKWTRTFLGEVTSMASSGFSVESMHQQMNMDCKDLLFFVVQELLKVSDGQKAKMRRMERKHEITLHDCSEDAIKFHNNERPVSVACNVGGWMNVITRLQATIAEMRQSVVQNGIAGMRDSQMEVLTD